MAGCAPLLTWTKTEFSYIDNIFSDKILNIKAKTLYHSSVAYFGFYKDTPNVGINTGGWGIEARSLTDFLSRIIFKIKVEETFTEALFIIAQNWKLSKCLSTGVGTGHLHTTKHPSTIQRKRLLLPTATGMDLKRITLHENNPVLLCHLYNILYTTKL